MRAALLDTPPLVHHYGPIAVKYGVKPVSDLQDSAVAQMRSEDLLHETSRVWVHIGCGLIKTHHLGLL